MIQINDLGKGEKEKWIKNRNEKFKKGLEKLKTKHSNDSQIFHKKMNSIFNEFKKNRATETEM